MLGADPTMTIVLCAVPQFEVHFILLLSDIIFCLHLVDFLNNAITSNYFTALLQTIDVINSYIIFGPKTNITFSLTNYPISSL